MSSHLDFCPREPPALITYFPNIISLADDGMSFLLLLSKIHGADQVDTPFLFPLSGVTPSTRDSIVFSFSLGL